MLRVKIINRKSKIENQKSTLWLAFITVTLIAFFFRFYRLADHPLGLFFDPAINGLDTIRFMQRGGSVIFFPTNGGREALLIYLLTPFIWLFGTTPFAFRLQLAIISLLNVVCLFACLYHVRFTIYDLRFTIYDLRFTNDNNSIRHSPFAIRHSPFAIRHSPFAIRHSPFAIWFAALAGLTLAVSYWHISLSRGDQRPLTVPLLAVLVFWFFLRGWSRNQKRWFVLSGLFMGLGFHTYSAARLLPLILLLAWLPEIFSRNRQQSAASPWDAPRNRQQSAASPWDAPRTTHHAPRLSSFVSRLILIFLPALLIAAPLLGYFATHPAQFSARAASVMVWAYLDSPPDILAELGRNLLRVLGFFCCAGSSNAIFGLPGYPGLSPLLTPFLIIGLIHALKNWRILFFRLVALWWLIGIVPSIIAIEAPHPLRMIVALPATAILVALGLIVFSTWLHAHIRGQGAGVRFYILPLILVLATIPNTFLAYFIEWPKLPVTQGIYDYGAVAIRDVVLEQAHDSRPIYLPLARFNNQPLLFYLSGTFQREAALSTTPADDALVISPEKNERDSVWVRLQGNSATILPPLTAEGQQLIQAALTNDSTQAIQTPRGETVARLASLPADPVRFAQQPTHPVTATFGSAQLMGATYPMTIDPTSGKLPVTLYWQATQPMDDDFEVALQLVDDSRRVWGDGTARPNDWAYPTTFWRPGLDTVAAQQVISLTTPPPPGRYWLAVALYHPAAGQRLPLIEGVSDSADTFFIGPLKAPLPAPPPLPLLQGGTVNFGDVAQLSGASVEAAILAPGEPIQLSLLWESLNTPPLDYTIFVHLLDANDKLVAGSDTQPVNQTYPTTLWTPGERILDHHTLPTPAALPPGQYRLALGMYHQPTGQRLPLHFADGRQDTSGRFILPASITLIPKK